MKQTVFAKSLLSAVSLSAALAAPALAGGTYPSRAITNPKSIVSEQKSVQKVPVKDLFFLRESWYGVWTPDSKNLVISTDLTGRLNLWKVPVDGGFPTQLQQSEDKAFYPNVSGNGKYVYYASDIGGREIFHIYRIPLTGGDPVKIGYLKDGCDRDPEVSPDSKSIAFTRRMADESMTNVAIMDADGSHVRLLTHEKAPGIYWWVAGFSPDGTHVLANRTDVGFINSTAWSIDIKTGVATQIKSGLGAYSQISSVSPDGHYAGMTGEDKGGMHVALIRDLKAGTSKVLMKSEWPQHTLGFSSDGKYLMAAARVDGRDQTFLYDLKAGTTKVLPLPKGVNSDYYGKQPTFSPDGKKIMFPHSAGNAPFDYWVYDIASATSHPVTHLGLASVSEKNLAPTQIVHYKSVGGLTISAVLWMPYNLKRDGKNPVVVYPHGGPTGETDDSFDPVPAALASRGYIVIAPNPRGSTGYGRAFVEANKNDLGGADLADEANAARFLIKSGYADPKKIGITGGSYGGYMTVMAVSKMPKFWAAGVERYGIVNWTSLYNRSQPALREYVASLMGTPKQNPEVFKKSSPLTYIHDVQAPLLVLQGENDIRVPKYEAEQIVTYLKKDGKTVDAKYYAEEGHGFMKRGNKIDAMQRTLDWFKKYLKDKK